MSEHWTQRRADSRDIDETPHGSSSSSYETISAPTHLPSTSDAEPVAGKATKAAIIEIALRYPCPANVDPERYDARLSLLAKDCAGLAPGLLRKAGDRLATRCKFLPSAAEIYEAAAEIVHERAEAERVATERADPSKAPTSTLAFALQRRNLELISNGFRFADGEDHRWAIIDGKPELVRVSGDRRRGLCNGDGTVRLAHWSDRDREWMF